MITDNRIFSRNFAVFFDQDDGKITDFQHTFLPAATSSILSAKEFLAMISEMDDLKWNDLRKSSVENHFL